MNLTCNEAGLSRPTTIERSITYSTDLLFSSCKEAVEQVAAVESFSLPLKIRVIDLLQNYMRICARELHIGFDDAIYSVSIRCLPDTQAVVINAQCKPLLDRIRMSVAPLSAIVNAREYGTRLLSMA